MQVGLGVKQFVEALSQKYADDVKLLNEEFVALESDHFRCEGRSRRYAPCIVFPWNNTVHWVDHIRISDTNGISHEGYNFDLLGSEFNVEVTGNRFFSTLSEKIKETKLVNQMVLKGFEAAFKGCDLNMPVYVGVHMIRYRVDKDRKIVYSTPNSFHRDACDYGFVHLINKENVTGGRTYIADSEFANWPLNDVPKDRILDQFTMENPFDYCTFSDANMSHYVSDMYIANEEFGDGFRDIMVILYYKMQLSHSQL